MKNENVNFASNLNEHIAAVEQKKYPLPIWQLSKCFDGGSVRNSLQINYGIQSVSILITDDLYQAIAKIVLTEKEQENE